MLPSVQWRLLCSSQKPAQHTRWSSEVRLRFPINDQEEEECHPAIGTAQLHVISGTPWLVPLPRTVKRPVIGRGDRRQCGQKIVGTDDGFYHKE
jgi:hypothetical protein